MTSGDAAGGGRSAAELSEALLAYLLRRPNSMDTLEGIAAFWLAGEGPVNREQLVAAVEGLVAAGTLERVPLGTKDSYRMRRPGSNGAGP